MQYFAVDVWNSEHLCWRTVAHFRNKTMKINLTSVFLLIAIVSTFLPQQAEDLALVVGGQGSDVSEEGRYTCQSSCTDGGVACKQTGQACMLDQSVSGLCNEIATLHSAKCVSGDEFKKCETSTLHPFGECVTALQGTPDPSRPDNPCYSACVTRIWTCGTRKQCIGGG